MRAWPRGVLHSLAIRLLVPLFLTVGGVLTAYAFVSFRSTHDRFLELVTAEARRGSDLIRRATHDGMLLNRFDDVQATIERLAESPDIAAIHVYDKDGGVVLSANGPEIGSRIRLDADPCLRCHPAGAARPDDLHESSVLMHRAGRSDVLRYLSVIENAPACSASGCHAAPSAQSILGVLEVEMSLAPLEAAASAAKRQLVLATAALMLVIGLVATVFIRRLVFRPIVALRQGTQRLAAGDLDARISLSGQHEFGRLGAAFNRMAGDLQSARRELTEWSQTLEDKVVEKTEELRHAQRQVLHMEKMASLGKLSATVAHELNNPLSGVLTYARLVERELGTQPLAPETHEDITRYLGLIQRECARCGDIVQNLLLFARRRGAEMALIDLNEIVDRSIMLVRHHVEISEIRLVTELLDYDTQVTADAGQLQQALVALLVNAVEAMDRVERNKELGVRMRGAPDEVHIDISDTGVGIHPDVLPHIFEPFFSTKGEESGVGLGLAVVYGIIHRHGGTIHVESEVGVGTSFHVTIPRTPAVPADQAVEAWQRPPVTA